MYDRDALLDIHGRAHESLRRLIAFCRTLTTMHRAVGFEDGGADPVMKLLRRAGIQPQSREFLA